MKSCNKPQCKAILEFPLSWKYRIILDGAKNKNFLNELEIFVKENKLDATSPVEGNKSKSGTYSTWLLSVTFQSKEEMESTSIKLGKLNGVKFLL